MNPQIPRKKEEAIWSTPVFQLSTMRPRAVERRRGHAQAAATQAQFTPHTHNILSFPSFVLSRSDGPGLTQHCLLSIKPKKSIRCWQPYTSPRPRRGSRSPTRLLSLFYPTLSGTFSSFSSPTSASFIDDVGGNGPYSSPKVGAPPSVELCRWSCEAAR